MNPPTALQSSTWAPDTTTDSVPWHWVQSGRSTDTVRAQSALTTAVWGLHAQVRSRDQASRQDTLMLVTCDEVRVPEPIHSLLRLLR
jgi:hypothetical protein